MGAVGAVYLISNTANCRLYVGQTSNPKRRWKEHCSKGCDHVISRAIRKHGREKFRMVVLGWRARGEQLDKLERIWIAALSTTNRGLGYNLTHGGDAAFSHIESTRRKISETMRKKGIAPSASVRAAANKANTGAKRSAAAIEKMKRVVHPKWTPEHRANVKAAKERKKQALKRGNNQ